jgi:hypothetical protein
MVDFAVFCVYGFLIKRWQNPQGAYAFISTWLEAFGRVNRDG